MLSVVSKVTALLFVLRIFSTRLVAPMPTLYRPRGEREVVVAQRVVEMRTRSGTSNRLRFTRNIPLPITLLSDLFLVINGSIVGAFEDSNASDGLLLDRLDFVPIETKGFFLLIIGCMTSACIWSPLAKIRRFTAFLFLLLLFCCVAVVYTASLRSYSVLNALIRFGNYYGDG